MFSEASAHLWAHVHAWCAADPTPPNTAAASRALRAVSRQTLLGFDVAVHAGWVPLSGHRVDGCPDEAGATCRWVAGWFPVSQLECRHLASAPQRCGAPSLELAVRLEYGLVPYAAVDPVRERLFDSSDSDDPIFSYFVGYDDTQRKPTTWRAPRVMVCETCPADRSAIAMAGRWVDRCGRSEGSSTGSGWRARAATDDEEQEAEEDERGGGGGDSDRVDAPADARPPRLVSQALRRCAAEAIELFPPSEPLRLSRRAFHCMRATLTRCDTRGAEGFVLDCDWGFLRGCHALRWAHLGGLRGISKLPDGFCEGCAQLDTIDGLDALGGVTRVGDHCFRGCARLSELDLRVLHRVSSIGDHFAASCCSLLRLDLSALMHLETIGQHFGAYGLASLTEVRLDGLSRVRRVGKGFLQDATALRQIDLSGLANVTFVGDFFLKDAAGLVDIVAAPDATTFAKIRCLGQGFLENCGALERVVGLNFRGLAGRQQGLPTQFMFKCGRLRCLDVASFAGLSTVPDDFCVSLHALTHVCTIGLAPGLHTVGDRFLHDAKSLASIDLAGLANVTRIGSHFLAHAPLLRAVDLSPLGSVTTVGSHFFNKSDALVSVNLGSLRSLQALGPHFFSECRRLEAIEHAPASGGLYTVAALPNHCFADCPALRSFDTAPLCNARSIGSAFLYGATGLTSIDTAGLGAVASVEDEFMAETRHLRTFDASTMTALTTTGDYFLANAEALTSVDTSGFTALRSVGANFVSGTRIVAFDASPFVRLISAGESFLYGNRALMSFRTTPSSEAATTAAASDGLLPLRDIPECGLSECDALTEVDLGGFAGLRSIGAWALSGCPALHAIDLEVLDSVTLEHFSFSGTPAVANASALQRRKAE